jgi:hypothetical protein
MSVLPIVLALLLAVPQQPVAPGAGEVTASPKELVVSSHAWGQVVQRTILMPGSRPSITQEPWDWRRPRRRRGGPPLPEFLARETYMLVRNSGTRTVKSVTWAYVFFNNAKHERELRRFQFQSKEKIAPGEMKFVSEAVKDAAPSAFGEVVIERIEFADGTTWPASAGTVRG